MKHKLEIQPELIIDVEPGTQPEPIVEPELQPEPIVEPELQPEPCFPYDVEVRTENLLVYKAPGTNQLVVGMFNENQILSISNEAFGIGASKWGELSNGEGWVILDNCGPKMY